MWIAPTLLTLTLSNALIGRVHAVTIYTTLTDDNGGSAVQPSNTNTATGPAYTGFTGAYLHC